MRRPGRDMTFRGRPLLGGLDTKTPATALSPDRSPDLQNVLLNNRAVEKRGGFTPLRSRRPKLNSIRNTGHHARARESTSGGSSDGDYLIVPGCMHGGHRLMYENLSGGLTVEFFFEVGDLTTEHGGNGEPGAAAWGPSPYTLKVRPVLSKGPVKRTHTTTPGGPHTGGTSMTWDGAAGNVWGNGSSVAGLPFCIYLFNNSGTWEWRLSFHTFGGGIWNLQTAVSTATVEVGGLYHVIAQIDMTAETGRIRVGRIRRKEATTYVEGSVDITGESYTQGNKGPIQVFDCPQEFIEATATGGATQRPGLGLNAATDGGYWFACKRAEGRIEDIAIYGAPKITATATALDRTIKLDPDNLDSDIINYWSMNEPGDGYVKEMTGRGNHLYLVPSGPVFDGISGSARPEGSWWFNGTTSYALADMENLDNFNRSNPAWRYLKTGPVPGWMTDAVRGNIGHGIQVDFWVDAVEPNFEQVLMEIHSVLRLAIDKDGKLVGYCRDGTGATGTSLQSQGATYQGPVTSTITVQPGQRYSVTLFRQTGGTQLDLYVNGQLDASATGLTAADTAANDGRPCGGITFGMGSLEPTIRNDAADYVPPIATGDNLPDINDLNTDTRSGFIGRIESGRILGSDPTVQEPYKDTGEEDWEFNQSRLWRNLSASRTIARPRDLNNTVANVGAGVALEVSGHLKDGQFVRYLVTDTTNPNVYTLSRSTLDNQATGGIGHENLSGLWVRTWHTFAQWVFCIDDRLDGYGGAYEAEVEYHYPSGATTTDPATANPDKAVHTQLSAVTDDLQVGGIIKKRCVESDVMDPHDQSTRVLSHRQRPYQFNSPRELSAWWAEGIVEAREGTNHVTLLADWEDQSAGERFLILGCGRQLYWSRPPWRLSSPYSGEGSTKSLWFGGQLGDHVKVKATDSELALTGTATKTTVAYECWLYPQRLDGDRLICARVTPATNDQTNFMIHAVDGQIRVEGTEGGNTRAWAWYQGEYISGTFVRPTASLQANTWNHLHVTIRTGVIEVRVNGNWVPMVNFSSVTSAPADPLGTLASDIPVGEFYIGGLPASRNRLTLTSSTGNRELELQAWHGMMADIRQRNDIDPAFPTTSNAGTAPKSRLQQDNDTYLLLPLNEGEGWHVINQVDAATDGDGQVEMEELLLLKEGLEESRGARWEFVVYRDRLFLTNGRADPHLVRFTRYTDSAGPFRVERVGMAAPLQTNTRVQIITTGVTNIPAADYRIWQTFINEDGKESEVTQVGNFVTTTPYDTLTLHLSRAPRSVDPQVVTRRYYISPEGGGEPIFFKDLPNNSANEVDFEIAGHTVGLGVTAGERLPAPRARHISVGSQSLILGDLVDLAAGQNVFAVSQAAEPTYFTVDGSAIRLDSEDGKPITGIQGHLGQLYLSKRDSIFSFGYRGLLLTGQFEASLRTVNTSAGFGSGRVVQDNLVYGAGDRGVYAFDGANTRYDGDSLERDWQSFVDKSDDGLVAMFGAWYRPNSQYWLSVRRRGEDYNRTVYVMHTAAGAERAWTRQELPPHTYLQEVLDPNDQELLALIGTTSGHVLRYDPDVLVDYHADGVLSNDTLTLSGTDGTGGESLSGTSTSLTISGSAGEFDNAGDLLVGATVKLTYDNGSNFVTTTRTIQTVSRTQITWDEPLEGFSSYTLGSFVIGGYLAYWTSGWVLGSEAYGHDHRVDYIDADFLPNAGNLTVEVQGARAGKQVAAAWDSGAAESSTVAMTSGYMDQPIGVQNVSRERWLRVRFSTDDIRTPFGLVGWGVRWEPLHSRGTPGKLS